MRPYLFSFIIICNFLSCSSPTEETTDREQQEEAASNALHIHFQSGFYQDTVSLFHGKEKIYEKVLTTEEDSKLTDQFTMPLSAVKDTLYFRVAQQGQVLRGFIPPNAEQYVGFYLTSGTAVNIYSKSTPFTYQ